MPGKKVKIIHLHLGDLPPWFGFFLAGINSNPKFNWIIITTDPQAREMPPNAQLYQITRKELTTRIHSILGINLPLDDPRKLCDLKPAYGLLFGEFLQEADWWGYCDNDMIFGQLDQFLPAKWFDQEDIISLYHAYLSGPLAFFRNTPEINKLFEEIPSYRTVLQERHCMGMDEHLANHPAKKDNRDYFRFPCFLLRSVARSKAFGFSMKEARYRYFWEIKKRQSGKNGVYDMTDLVLQKKQNGQLSVRFSDLLVSDAFFSRTRVKKWQLAWKNGKLTEEYTGNQICAFHFREIKNRLQGMREVYYKEFPVFTFNKEGFHD